jgi:DNA-binding beta-propeller fold protein YncE
LNVGETCAIKNIRSAGGYVMRVACVIFLLAAVLCVFRCGQEDIFDLADGTDMVLAIGYDTTTKIIAVEPDAGYMKVYDTGIATGPEPGAVIHAHEKILWFLIATTVYRWELSEGSSPSLIFSPPAPGTFGLSGNNNIIVQDNTSVYSITRDGVSTSIATVDANITYYRDLFFPQGDGGLLLTQTSGRIYRLSSDSVSLLVAPSYTPLLISGVGSASFITQVDGELFVGTDGGQLYRDFNTNGTTFVAAITKVPAIYGAAYYIASSSVWYIAYQQNTGMDITVLRYDNGVPSTVASIPTTGIAYVFLRHYKGDRLILGVGDSASAKGLYVIDAGKKSYTLLSGSYRIYGLSRVDQ